MFGRDIRRLRPSLLINGVAGLGETAWEGAELIIGRAIIELDSLRGRCPMTTVDPDTITRDRGQMTIESRRLDVLAADAVAITIMFTAAGQDPKTRKQQVARGAFTAVLALRDGAMRMLQGHQSMH